MGFERAELHGRVSIMLLLHRSNIGLRYITFNWKETRYENIVAQYV